MSDNPTQDQTNNTTAPASAPASDPAKENSAAEPTQPSAFTAPVAPASTPTVTDQSPAQNTSNDAANTINALRQLFREQPELASSVLGQSQQPARSAAVPSQYEQYKAMEDEGVAVVFPGQTVTRFDLAANAPIAMDA